MATASKTPWVGALVLLIVLLAPHGGRAAAPPFEVRALLVERQFDRLERLLGEAQARFESGAGSEGQVIELFSSFATTDPDLEAPLDAWNEAYPESAVAPLARAHYDEHRGWLARGDDYIQDTPKSRLALMRELFDQAQADAASALKRNKKQSLAYGILINVGKARGQPWVEEAMLRGLEEAPRSYAIRWIYLHNLTPEWGGSLDEIRAFLETHVRSAPNQDDMGSLYGFPDFLAANALYRKGLREQALEYYSRALGHGQQSAYLVARASTFKRLKRYDEALADYDRALELSPSNSPMIGSRAVLLYWKLKDKQSAHADWERAIRLDPLRPDNLYFRAYVFKEEERYDEAMADLEAALVYGENDHRIHGLRGSILLYITKDYVRGAAALKRATELNPDSATHWYFYAEALIKLQDCGLVPAMRRYLAICEASGTCPQEYTDYAAEKIKWLHERGVCQNE